MSHTSTDATGRSFGPARFAVAAALMLGLAACATGQAATGPTERPVDLSQDWTPVERDAEFRRYLVRRDARVFAGPTISARTTGQLTSGQIVMARVGPADREFWLWVGFTDGTEGYVSGTPFTPRPDS